ncbi:flavin reductase family protein [Streptomyces lushanensis]|uniref:flavin reductase family protein n=1 Tax=Streptomyces lushanensis TaxID=1434255 RepID=UPI000832F6C9|nr:flavin reductase family protein [Streptomyces lushanensis]
MTNQAGTTRTRPDVADFRATMGCFPTGVTLLTCGRDDDLTVMTLNSLTSVSLDPLLVLVSVKADGRMRPRVRAHGGYAVNVLSSDQGDLSREFCLPDRPEGAPAMSLLGAVPGVTGNAVVPSAAAWLECELHREFEAGDHALLVGRVLAVSGGGAGRQPLVFHRGGYTDLPGTSGAGT